MKLTKLIAGLGTAALTAALALTVSAADPVVVWDFTQADNALFYNEDGTAAFDVNGATAAYDADNACLNVDVDTGDPYFILPNQGTFPAENSFVRVKYNLTDISDWSTSIYFTTDTVQWSETGHWKGIYDGDDDVWCEQTFYMTECAAWAGTITDMRLDIFDSAYDGQIAKVAYVAVFGNEEDANNFDFAAWQANGRPVTLSAPAAAGPALPSTEYDSIANYAGIKPVIDGKIDAIWDATAAQESTWPGDRDGEGISGYTKILWDEDNLYFLGVVNDPTTLQEANPTTTDSIDFWVSETYSDEMGYPLEGDYQLALSPYNTYGGNKAPDLVNETGAVINGDGTYVVEFSIPWQTQGLTPAAGHVIGYNASFNNDLEGDGARDSWTSWVEWTNMPYWSDTMWLGHVELVKADVAVAVEEAPAAEAEAPAAAEPADGLQNLCLGASIYEISGLETEGSNTGEMAIDGDLATRWSSNTDDNAHIIIDIGQPLPIGYVEIHWETACAADYTIETSSDATSWDVRATVTGNTKGTSPASADCIAVHEWEPATARYIKINCTKRNTEWGNSIWEVVARKGADTTASTAPAAYPGSGAEVPADSVLINGERIGLEEGWGGNAAAGRDAAFDGDVNTYFDPLGTGDGWAGIDAGEEMILTKIIIHPRDANLPRFNGGTIEGANEEDFSDAVALFFSVEEAPEFAYLDVTDEIEEADNTGYRYFRYINYSTHGDVAEVELYGKAVDGSNPTYGAAVEETPVEEAPVVEEEPVVEETPAEEPAAEEVVEETPAEEVVAEEPVVVEEEVVEEAPVEEAAETFDFAVIAAIAAAVSAAGYAISKKR